MTMNYANLILYIGGGVMIAGAGALFFIARNSQKVAKSLLDLLLQPDRAKIEDAANIVRSAVGQEFAKIDSAFKSMAAVLDAHIARADALRQNLSEQNRTLVDTASAAVKNTSETTAALEIQLDGLRKITGSSDWARINKISNEFSGSVSELLDGIKNKSEEMAMRIAGMDSAAEKWNGDLDAIDAKLRKTFEETKIQISGTGADTDTLHTKITELSAAVASGFESIKESAGGYEKVLADNASLMAAQLERMDAFAKQSKTVLATQLNNLSNTANTVGAQIRLAESSLEKQERALSDAAREFMGAAQETETAVRGISNEMSGLVGKFNGEIKEFATDVVQELSNVHGAADATLRDTKSAAGAFSESVRAMATGVRETLIEMNSAHIQLTAQSAELVKMSGNTTAQLQPLSELIEKYYSALPELVKGSSDMTDKLSEALVSLDEKIRNLAEATKKSLGGISESSSKLESVSGQSRQQMIDLLSDYAKAVDTMQTLNRQMTEAKASAPMQAISKAPVRAAPVVKITAAEFAKISEPLAGRLHELSVDLTRAVGAEIPESIWNKYNSGDRDIFSKWFAKMLSAADKRRVKELMKGDAVFRSQSSQFVRGFGKMLAAAEQSDNPDMICAALLNTELGQIHQSLKTYV
jgi:uncharacterized coiled-coil DUF342 family protein